jgi:hypothetical protein
MATRIYFPSTGTPSISPTADALWTVTTNADYRTAVTTRISSSMTDKAGAGDAATGFQLLRQYLIGPLAAQTITGAIKGQVRGMASVAGVGNLAVSVGKCNGSGTGVTQILAPTAADQAGSIQFTADPTKTNRRFEHTTDDFSLELASTGVSSGDYLIIGVGYDDLSGNAGRFVTLVFGDDSGTDLAEDESTTAANNPWIEFSADLTFAGGGTGRGRLIGGKLVGGTLIARAL